MQKVFTLKEVAERIGVRQHQVTYLLNSKDSSLEPERVGNRRLFTNSDIRKIAEALGKEVRDA